MIWMPIAMAILGLAYMLVKKSWVMKQDAGDGKMNHLNLQQIPSFDPGTGKALGVVGQDLLSQGHGFCHLLGHELPLCSGLLPPENK